MPVFPEVASISVRPGAEITGGEGGTDDRQRGAVLDRSAGIHPFHLEVDLDRFGQTQVPLEATQPNERRVADRPNDGGLREVCEFCCRRQPRDSWSWERPMVNRADRDMSLTGNPEFFIKK